MKKLIIALFVAVRCLDLALLPNLITASANDC